MSEFHAHLRGINHRITVNTPEKSTIPPDELERLEELHRKTKDEAEAWQKLLENLGKLRTKQTTKTENKKSLE